MKKILLDECDRNTVKLSLVDQWTAIFAKRDGKLEGMVVKEDSGWVLRTGGEAGATGYHPTIKGCLESCIQYGYEFYIE